MRQPKSKCTVSNAILASFLALEIATLNCRCQTSVITLARLTIIEAIFHYHPLQFITCLSCLSINLNQTSSSIFRRIFAFSSLLVEQSEVNRVFLILEVSSQFATWRVNDRCQSYDVNSIHLTARYRKEFALQSSLIKFIRRKTQWTIDDGRLMRKILHR